MKDEMPEVIYTLSMDGDPNCGFYDLEPDAGTSYTRTDIHEAEVKRLRGLFDKMTGYPIQAGIAEPIEGYAECPELAVDAVKRMATENKRLRDALEVARVYVSCKKTEALHGDDNKELSFVTETLAAIDAALEGK